MEYGGKNKSEKERNSMKRNEIPQQGLLQGVRVVVSAISVAGPFAAEVLADMGADVIQLENPKNPDFSHGGPNPGWQNESHRRNMRDITLDVTKPKGREAFLRLMKETDIFIESSKGGQWAGWGLSDEFLWKVNPKLVIAHISGYGRTGLKEYISRAAYDPIAQAFGGLVYANGDDTMPYFPIADNVIDYYTALFTSTSCLSAYINALRTGKGESLDIAQYECGLRTLCQYLLQDIVEGNPEKRSMWIAASLCSGIGNYDCKEGSVFMIATGFQVCKRLALLLGFPYGTDEFPAGDYGFFRHTENGKKVEAALQTFCKEHSASEVEKILNDNKIPCSQVLTYQDMLTNPQYLARESLTVNPSTRWEDPKNPGQPLPVTMPNIVPRAKNNPLSIWRTGVDFGYDTADVLADLGYSEAEIKGFFDKGISVSRQDACPQYKHL